MTRTQHVARILRLRIVQIVNGESVAVEVVQCAIGSFLNDCAERDIAKSASIPRTMSLGAAEDRKSRAYERRTASATGMYEVGEYWDAHVPQAMASLGYRVDGDNFTKVVK